ncbi:MAG: DUF4142 domain-containing protein [Tatlockia sp.]|jgi:putative membrane protein
MKLKFVVSLIAGTALLTGCGTMNNSDATAYPAVAYTKVQAQTDAKILGAIVALDQNEMAAGAEAQRKAVNPAVREFAGWMVKEHSQNMQAMEALGHQLGIAPIKGNLAMMLQKKGRQNMAMLKHLNGPAFDKAFINGMVQGHMHALQLLNTKLIPMAVNPNVKHHLEATRNHVMAHLQKAQAIQKQL